MTTIQELDGFLWPSFFGAKNYYLVRDLQFRKDDIILSTYPKCGTNWCAYTVWGLLHPDEPAPEGKKVTQDFAFVDLMGLGRWTGSPEDQGRLLVTHMPFDRLHMNTSTRFLTVVRNPLDCCVSFYHFIKEFPNAGYEDEEGQEIPSTFFKDFIEGKVPFGCYFKHLKACYDHRNDANLHFMVYEKMRSNPREEALKLATFLGIEKPLEANNGELLDKVVEQSSFDVMKKNVKYQGPDINTTVNIVRKGVAGGYKKSLTASQIETLKAMMEKELAGTELLELWRDI